MLLKPLIVIIFIFPKLSNQMQNFTEIMNLVTDLVIKQNNPTKIIAYVCWPKGVQMELWKSLSEKFYTTRIAEMNSPLYFSTSEEHQMFLFDAECPGSTETLQQAQRLKLFSLPFRWVIWGTNNNTFDGIFFGIDSRIFVITKRGTEYDIVLLYKLVDNSSRFYENYVSTWNSRERLIRFNEFSVPRNRSNFMGNAVRVSYVVTNPDTLNHLWDYRDKHIDAISKLNWILTHELLNYVNATSVKIFRNTWGYKNVSTSLYSGLIGDLQKDLADLGGTPSFFTLDRIGIVDYIASTNPTYMKFIFRAPPLSYMANVFTLPFDVDVWYSCLALSAIILLVLCIIVFWEGTDPIFKKKLIGPQVVEPNVFNVILLEVGAITQQGLDAEPKSSAGRIATIFTLVSLMFLYTSYSANIVAILQSTTENIRTLEDLLYSRISIGVEDIVYEHYYFENAEEPIKRKIYEQKVAPKGQKPNFMTLQEGIKRVREGFFAFHVEVSNGYKVVADTFLESEKCSLMELEYVNVHEPWLTVQKNSPYKEIFKVGMKKIHESGIQHREINCLYTKKPTCHTSGSNFGSAGLIDCYGAFLIFGIGIGTSGILLVLEILLKRYRSRMENPNITFTSPTENPRKMLDINQDDMKHF